MNIKNIKLVLILLLVINLYYSSDFINKTNATTSIIDQTWSTNVTLNGSPESDGTTNFDLLPHEQGPNSGRTGTATFDITQGVEEIDFTITFDRDGNDSEYGFQVTENGSSIIDDSGSLSNKNGGWLLRGGSTNNYTYIRTTASTTETNIGISGTLSNEYDGHDYLYLEITDVRGGSDICTRITPGSSRTRCDTETYCLGYIDFNCVEGGSESEEYETDGNVCNPPSAAANPAEYRWDYNDSCSCEQKMESFRCDDTTPVDEYEINEYWNSVTDSSCSSIQPDTDGDGTTDCKDSCPNDPNKTAPGICGCGVAETDTDGDGVPDCNDQCPNDPNKTLPGSCGCGVSETDCGSGNNDQCPNDPNKTAPGICGCGVSDIDRDNDGTPDCNDQCPNDPNKTVPGICGCGVSDADLDGDGVPDCIDDCPYDPNKIIPGECGCGVAETDTDGDGVPDCNDQCPNDPNKTLPGSCGCGISDVDTDGDGIADCVDICPDDPSDICDLNDEINIISLVSQGGADCVEVGDRPYVEITWNYVGGAESYEVFRNGVSIMNISKDKNYYKDTGVTSNGDTYEYKIRYYDYYGNPINSDPQKIIGPEECDDNIINNCGYADGKSYVIEPDSEQLCNSISSVDEPVYIENNKWKWTCTGGDATCTANIKVECTDPFITETKPNDTSILCKDGSSFDSVSYSEGVIKSSFSDNRWEWGCINASVLPQRVDTPCYAYCPEGEVIIGDECVNTVYINTRLNPRIVDNPSESCTLEYEISVPVEGNLSCSIFNSRDVLISNIYNNPVEITTYVGSFSDGIIPGLSYKVVCNYYEGNDPVNTITVESDSMTCNVNPTFYEF